MGSSKQLLEKISVTYWTDATIVLHWIKGDVTRWKTFVANRVAYILDHSDSNQWRHVPTADNPADSATRGLSPSEISIFDLWWHGPSWLRQHSSEWPDTEVPNIKFDEQSLEAKSLQIRLHTTQVDINLIERLSTYTKLVRVIAYILRFCHNAQSKKTRSYSQLSPEELDNALRCVVKIVQAETFQSDMHAILAENPLPPKSTLRNLTPFLDDGILRVRGRLKHSNLSFDRKHPIILPQRHFFTELVIQNSHHATLHGGAHLTLAHTSRFEYKGIYIQNPEQHMYHAGFALAGGMFSPTVLGSYAQLIALPTEDEGQEIWQPDRTREKGSENYKLQRPEQHCLLLFCCPLRPIILLKLINEEE
ncbi:uncharacterized protein [Drosophila suzukii]|uniref:Integrase zinc-binding domain-containing protein n=1 Tax=Drosophila suzukii TaxID=28584 RepID=A0ABM4TZU9_DROSZ